MTNRRRRLPTAIAVLLACLLAGVTPADDGESSKFTTLDGEFQVNTYTTGRQFAPKVAADADGNFVVVWQSLGSPGTDASRDSVQGQLYASDGSAVGDQFQVNTFTTRDQDRPAVAMRAEGGFVVVWQSSVALSVTHIEGQRYATDGSALGDEFQVNSYTTTIQSYPSVTVHAEGGFTVVWRADASSGPDTSFSIQARRYAADGSTLGDEIQISSATTGDQNRPAVAAASDGGFVVVWDLNSPGPSGSSIQGRRFASDGSAVGDQFQVNSLSTGGDNQPAVAANAVGDFVVVWASNNSPGTDSSSRSVQGQRYASDGSALGAQFQVNSYTTYEQYRPSVAADAQGNFVVVWASGPYSGSGPDSSSRSVQGQRYAADGSPLGGEFQVNSYTTGYQTAASAVNAPNGTLVVVWQSPGSAGTDTSSRSIQGQRYVFESDLEISKSDGVSSANPGDTLVYTIVASNNGPDPAVGVSVTDTFPAGLTCSWTSVGQSGASGNSSSSGDLADTLTLPVGAFVVYTVDCVTDLSLNGVVINTATISSSAVDAAPGNNSATDVTRVPDTIFADGFESADTTSWSTTRQ